MTKEHPIKSVTHPPPFEMIYDAHYSTIFNYCYRRLGDFDMAKDMTSETFLKAYLHLGRFRWRGVPILNWLYRIATNEINLHFRAQRYRPRLVRDTYGSDFPEPSLDYLQAEKKSAELEMEQHGKFLQVQKALKELPLKYQEVISLRFFEQLKIKEIGSILKKKEGTVKSLLSRGLSRLKAKVSTDRSHESQAFHEKKEP